MIESPARDVSRCARLSALVVPMRLAEVGGNVATVSIILSNLHLFGQVAELDSPEY